LKLSPIKRILVVAESIDVEDSSGTKGRVALIKNLQKAGFEVLVYHYTRKQIHIKGIKCIGLKENRLSIMFFLSRAERLLRHKLKLDLHIPLEKVFGFSFTLFNDRNSIAGGLRKIKDFEPDLVLTLSKGGSFRPHHALLKIPEWHHKWMAYIHDPYPMHLYPRPFAWVEPGYFRKWEFVKDVSEKAAYSAFPSQLLKEWMGSYFPQFLNTGVVIPHQIETTVSESDNLPTYFEPERFNLLHAGNLLGPRNPIFLIEAFKQFLERNPEAASNANLIFIGNHTEQNLQLQDYEEIIKEGNLIIKPSLDYRTVLTMQKLAAVNIILEAKSEISPFLPGKFPHCVMANKPILLLGPNLSESNRLLGEDYEFWSEIDNLEEISFLIEKLYLQWKAANGDFQLNRPDLEYYLSEKHLKSVINEIKIES